MAGGIETIAAAIREDLRIRLPEQNKKQREGLALLRHVETVWFDAPAANSVVIGRKP